MADKLTDEEVRVELARANVPLQYCKPDRKLADVGSFIGKEMVMWLTDEGYRALSKESIVVEVVTDSEVGTDAFYMMARACLLTGLPIACIHARDFLSLELGDVWDIIKDLQVLAIDGMVTSNLQFSPAEIGKLEWVLWKWVSSGKSLILLHERAIDGANEFSKRWRNIMKSMIRKRFVNE